LFSWPFLFLSDQPSERAKQRKSDDEQMRWRDSRQVATDCDKQDDYRNADDYFK
jgi:hypothetical protein